MSFPKARNEADFTTNPYNRLLIVALVGDLLVVASSLILAFLLRFNTPFSKLGVVTHEAIQIQDYLAHYIIGAVLMMLALAYFRFYERKNLLALTRTMRIAVKATLIWTVACVALALILKFSRLYCVISISTLLILLTMWRALFWSLLKTTPLAASLRQHLLIVGWTNESAKAMEQFGEDHNHHFDIVGVVPPPDGDFKAPVPDHMPMMGHYESLPMLLKMRVCQAVVVVDDTLRNTKFNNLASLCEKEMIEFKLSIPVPGYSNRVRSSNQPC